ncbi:MAG: bifunctional folylpolyglutamate synthase/dihydrofolate synthase [Chloroflexia bacterium]|nr:bifunctional folylpolyglutamate synthase/dihydrofolate synthase [Chloroflexia bacterium]
MAEPSPYEQALDYIESFMAGPAILPGLSPEEHTETMRQRMPRMRYLLRLLGDPQQRYHTVHIGGTSGKGSTATMLAAILQAAGLRSGLYTSPYLQSPRELWTVDGHMASHQAFADLVAACRPAIERMRRECALGTPSYMEIWAGLALAYFAAAQVDCAVVEVIAGGRFDPTNLIQPLAAAVTTVHYDHLETLGPTLERIAWHKAGIAKKGVPLVTGVQDPALLQVLQQECQQQGAPLLQVGRDTRYELRQLDRTGGRFDFYGLDGQSWPDLQVALLGAHQVANAATAVTVVQALQRYSPLEIPEAAVRQGLARARFAGRLELVQQRPDVLLDGAHNPEKMARLRQALDGLFPGRRRILVLGLIAAKDMAGVLPIIAPGAAQIVATTAPVRGKAVLDPEAMRHFLLEQGVAPQQVHCEPEAQRALQLALDLAGPDDLVCVTGSLYLVGRVRELWYPVGSGL